MTGKVTKTDRQEKYLQGKVVRMTGKVAKMDRKEKYLQSKVSQTGGLVKKLQGKVPQRRPAHNVRFCRPA
jgi:peptidoglycan hydrolase CwlO-like protein